MPVGRGERRRLGDRRAAPAEGGERLLHRGAVQPDRLLDRVGCDRDAAVLEGGADQQHVGRHVIAEQRLGQALRVDVQCGIGTGRRTDAVEGLGGRAGNGDATGDHGRRRHHRGAHHGDRVIAPGGGEVRLGRRAEQVEADEHVRGATGGAQRPAYRLLGDADVAHHRAALLRQPDLLEPGGVAPVQERGHLQDLRDRDDPGPADPGHPEQRGVPGEPALRLGQPGGRLGHRAGAAAAWLDQQERRAVALEAGQVGVAGRLVDAGLAAELGVHRLHGQARRDLAAVAAALAHPLVDHDLLGGRRQLARACAGGAPRRRSGRRGSGR